MRWYENLFVWTFGVPALFCFVGGKTNGTILFGGLTLLWNKLMEDIK